MGTLFRTRGRRGGEVKNKDTDLHEIIVLRDRTDLIGLAVIA